MKIRLALALVFCAGSCSLLMPAFGAELSQTEKPAGQATELKTAAESDYDPDSLAQLNHEAINAFRTEQFERAEKLMEQVVAGLDKEKHSELSLAEALTNLSIILKREGKENKESQTAIARAKAIREKLHMPPIEHNLVDILPNANYRKQGTDMVKETSDILEGKDPLFPEGSIADKSAQAWSIVMLEAQQEKQKGDIKKEYMSLRKALAIAHAFPSPNDKIIASMNMLADAYRHMGRPYSARMLFLECLSLNEKLGKAESAEFATLLDHAAQTLLVLHEYDEAEKLLERAIQIYKKALGHENADLAMTMCTLGELYLQQKQDEKGEKLLTEALAMMKKTLKSDDLRILISEDCLATYYSRKGRLKEADALQTAVVSKMEKVYGKANANLALAMNNLAQTKYRQQKYSEAEPLLKQCIEMNRRLYGQKHPKTRHSIGAYASFLEKTGKKQEADELLKEITK